MVTRVHPSGPSHHLRQAGRCISLLFLLFLLLFLLLLLLLFLLFTFRLLLSFYLLLPSIIREPQVHTRDATSYTLDLAFFFLFFSLFDLRSSPSSRAGKHRLARTCLGLAVLGYV